MVSLENNILGLKWEGPFTIKDRNLYEQKLPGVYLFTVKTNDYYSVYYIGMTTRGLSERIIGTDTTPGHFREMASGRYYLYNSDKLKKLSLEAEYSLTDNFFEFFSNLEKYQEIVLKNLEAFSFFVCPFEERYKSQIEIAESMLIHHVYSLDENKKKEFFPINDNCNKVSSKIYNTGIVMVNTFPNQCIVNGFMSEIHAPKN